MQMKDGRQCIALPWVGQTATPWRAGYSRVFILFTAAERRNARIQRCGLAKAGHIQIVRNTKLS